jgi:hypothetical protein
MQFAAPPSLPLRCICSVLFSLNANRWRYRESGLVHYLIYDLKIASTCENLQTCYNVEMKMVEAISGMTRTYTFVFDPDPEGGFVVTCPALPGLVTHGATIEEARGSGRNRQ